MPRKPPPSPPPHRLAPSVWHGPVMRMSSTDVKNRFGEAVAEAERRGVVVVTRHDRPQVVLLSVGVFEALAGTPLVDLGALESAFAARVGQMQTLAQAKAIDSLFGVGARQESR